MKGLKFVFTKYGGNLNLYEDRSFMKIIFSLIFCLRTLKISKQKHSKEKTHLNKEIQKKYRIELNLYGIFII